MDMKEVMRYVAIAHVRNNGDIEYANVLDNSNLYNSDLEGADVPDWLAERVALLRLCEVNRDQRGETIGRKFTDNMMYVYLTYDEYQELSDKILGVQK
jgi:hypothetical protein